MLIVLLWFSSFVFLPLSVAFHYTLSLSCLNPFPNISVYFIYFPPSMATFSPLPFLSLSHPKPKPRVLGRRNFRHAQCSSSREDQSDFGGLSVLYDDGFGSQSVKDYFAAAKEVIKPDGAPPRWFCPVECGKPITNSPVLMYLPGLDGTGMGLILHHKSLGKVFEVRCLHIPVDDRTPFEGLVKFVENSIKNEHATSRNKPIYLVGDSFGGCLALAVAARNPSIDLILILVNPATSYEKSQLKPFVPVLEILPGDLHTILHPVISLIRGGPVNTAMASALDDMFPRIFPKNIIHFLPILPGLADILSKETFVWKLKLLKSGAAYSNSRLHAVKAEVLLLASGMDSLLPSGDEVDRLWTSLKNCRVRFFKDSGHTLLLDEEINLWSVIKSTTTYRRSRKHDFISDYLPPTASEFRKMVDEDNRLFRYAASPVMFSTLKDGSIVKGLSGVPDEGPVLLVGYHTLLSLDLNFLYEAFLRQKNVILRGMTHPCLFKMAETSREFSVYDLWIIFGALPVSARNMYRLFSKKAFVLLFPGGVREALHRKGEEYKLFWPDRPEFVRMAAEFEATILPFGVVGEDELLKVVLDYNDLMNIPFVGRSIQNFNRDIVKVRTDVAGEVSNQDIHLPALMPQLPGRLYYLFGKPFKTQGKGILKDPKIASEVYSQMKSEIEGMFSYLKKKREDDPYRSILQRIVYENSGGSSSEVPTFEP